MITVNGSTDIRVLVGWKEIAERLGVCVATAQRWERERGLPTYRLGGSVRLDSDDLERWLRNFKQI